MAVIDFGDVKETVIPRKERTPVQARKVLKKDRRRVFRDNVTIAKGNHEVIMATPTGLEPVLPG